jgi:hypothetical protein
MSEIIKNLPIHPTTHFIKNLINLKNKTLSHNPEIPLIYCLQYFILFKRYNFYFVNKNGLYEFLQCYDIEIECIKNTLFKSIIKKNIYRNF